MKKIALAGLVVLGLTAVAPSAFAQCPPGSWLCADITIGTTPPPPPPTVYVQPPVTYVAPPPPPRVYVVPAPPPVVVYQPPPQPMYVQPPVTYVQPPRYMPPARRSYLGIQAQLSGAFLSTPSSFNVVGGGGAGLRFRGTGHFGGELALNVNAGNDYNNDFRTEVPVTFTGLFYFNPQNRFQIYGLAGVGFSVADVQYRGSNVAAHGGHSGADYAYLGGHIGVGAELQLSPHISLFADVRGFLRGRVDDGRDANPEFARTLPSGATQTANGSAGVYSQAGAIVYF